MLAHFHYTIMGGLIFAFMAAIYYWLPKMMGIKLNEALGKIHFYTMFVFFNSTFLPLFAVGLLGQPRRVFEYQRQLQTLNDWVSISAFLLGGSILIFVINFVWSTVIARVPETGNPWRSRGLEWQVLLAATSRTISLASPSCCPGPMSTACRTRRRSPT